MGHAVGLGRSVPTGKHDVATGAFGLALLLGGAQPGGPLATPPLPTPPLPTPPPPAPSAHVAAHVSGVRRPRDEPSGGPAKLGRH